MPPPDPLSRHWFAEPAYGPRTSRCFLGLEVLRFVWRLVFGRKENVSIIAKTKKRALLDQVVSYIEQAFRTLAELGNVAAVPLEPAAHQEADPLLVT